MDILSVSLSSRVSMEEHGRAFIHAPDSRFMACEPRDVEFSKRDVDTRSKIGDSHKRAEG